MDDTSGVTMRDDGAAEESATQFPPPAPPKIWQSAARDLLTPFLPPPVTRGIQRLDPMLAPYVGPEATVTLALTVVAAWWLVWVSRRLLSRSGRAVADDDDDAAVLSMGNDFDATVVLTGPRNAGKTRLFHQLCYNESNMPTLMSIKTNVGIATIAENNTRVRIMDWPGHASVSEPALATTISSKKDVRIVLVLDATQPVSAAADILYQLLSMLHAKKSRTPATIFVACHKKDLTKAKNDKRIKIQMRTEIERLLTSKSAAGVTAAWGTSPFELDELSFVNLHFFATTSEGKGSPQLIKFCQYGVLPEATAP